MQILFLTQILPYPPDAGPKVKTWHVLRYLADRGHNVTLVSFIREGNEQHLPQVKEVCQEVHTVPIRRSRLADVGYWLRSHLTGRPFLVERDDLPPMRELVRKLIDSGQYDAVHADQLTMTQFALPRAGTASGLHPARATSPSLIFDAHNAVWTIVDRMAENASPLLKPVLGLECRRIKAFEGKVVSEYDHTLAVIEPDRTALIQAARTIPGGNGTNPVISVIPIAVDTQTLQPIQRQPGSTNIMTLGTLHYPPNADGIRWFILNVMPRIRQEIESATLTVVGKNPPKDFIQVAQQPGSHVTVTGYVPDLDPVMAQASVLVVPVRAGGGMRVRILEAFARGMPVVTTTIGLEGIEARPGKDVLVADTPDAFAKAVIDLIQDTELQSRLASQGRALAERSYDWKVVLAQMDAIYA